MGKKGFTLIEILVAVFIIMLLVTIVSSNLVGARSKARDTVKKENMRQMVNALRMYYNDYNLFPGTSAGFQGCGVNGTAVCPALPCAEIEFSAGGTDCTDTIQYMKKFPKEFNPAATSGDATHVMEYYVSADRLEFRLFAELENAGDPAIVASQTRCPAGDGFSGLYVDTDPVYVVCEK